MHFSVDPAAPIYRQSSFLHGYAHGYEIGFHHGDLDLHMGREPRDPKSVKSFKDGKKTFQSGFGSRDTFVKGYQQGFRVGYTDAYNRRQFRAAKEARYLTQQFRDSGLASANLASPTEFDKGVAEGYKSGLAAGLGDARISNPFKPGVPACPKPTDSTTFCRGHGLGYELGYSDGYNNQRKPDKELKTASD